MPPPTSFSQKPKRLAYNSEDETTHIQGGVDNNTGTSQRLNGFIPLRWSVDEIGTPQTATTSTTTRVDPAGQRVGGARLAMTWKERGPDRWSQCDTVWGGGLKGRKSNGGSTGGVWPAGVVSALPRGRFDGSGTDTADRLASPPMSAGIAWRDQVVGSTTLRAEHEDQRSGAYRGFPSNRRTRDEGHPRPNPWHPSRAVHPAMTAYVPSSTTPHAPPVQFDQRKWESQQPPRNMASLAMSPPLTAMAGCPGVVPPRTPTEAPANARPHHGSNDNAISSSTVTSNGTSYYAGAHGLRIKEQYITTNNLGPSKTLFDYLNPHVAHGAAHNSNDRRDAPACHEETRVALRENIVGWIKDDGGDDEPRLMWLSGPAGSGKSAIAGSVATTCEDEGLLAGTFFFSSFSPSMDRRWSRGLIATLVHHMSQHDTLGEFSVKLLQALERRPDIFHKTLKEQAICLILEPFRGIPDHSNGRTGWPKVVIIDGVDEVVAPLNPSTDLQRVQRTPEDDQVEVLDVLLTLSLSPHFPFRIFVASRPERNITDFFDEPTVHRFTVPLFLDSKYDPDTDIERFLWSKFAQIRRRFRIPGTSWPGQAAVGRIVEMSSGQFIVPTTVIRWIESGIPKQQLDEVLKLQQDNTGSKNPFESLDALYRYILMRARTPNCDARLVVKWINTINPSMSQDPLFYSEIPAAFWRSFLEGEEGELDYRMAPISSLISIPPPDDTRSPITFYHKSLIDYLSNPTRCRDLYVGKEEVDSFISGRIVVVLKHMGPRVPLLPPQRLDDFLSSLRHLHLVEGLPSTSPELPVLRGHATFLNHLGGKELYTLVSCNVAWWAMLFALPHISITWYFLLRAIYFGIHRASKCIDLPVRQDLSARQAAQEEGNPGCHPACVHWRTGILAQVKELGWCTHRLEAMPLHKLQDVNFYQAENIFSMHAYKGCRVCKGMGFRRRFLGGDAALNISYEEHFGQYVPL